MENGILVELKYVDLISTDDSPDSIKRKRQLSQKWVPNNVAEYFFFDEFGFLSISEKKIRDCYQEFTQTMEVVYKNMQRIYNRYTDMSLTQEDIKRGIDFPTEITKEVEKRGLEYYFDKERHD